MSFRDAHRPLARYFTALAGAGFAIERLSEPTPSEEHFRRFPEIERFRGRPFLLHVRGVLAPGPAPGS